jgi:hypothetical protein
MTKLIIPKISKCGKRKEAKNREKRYVLVHSEAQPLKLQASTAIHAQNTFGLTSKNRPTQADDLPGDRRYFL